MKFGFEQSWTAAAGDVLAVYTDESFWQSLDGLTKTTAPTILGVVRSPGHVVVRLRYKLMVDLPREAARFIDPDDVAWVEETTWDLAARRAQIRFLPEQAAALLKASATAVVLMDGDEAIRRVTGELRVRIPLVGGRVENVIVNAIGEHLGEEADAVAEVLAARQR